MKKHTLFFLLVAGALHAQEPIKLPEAFERTFTGIITALLSVAPKHRSGSEYDETVIKKYLRKIPRPLRKKLRGKKTEREFEQEIVSITRTLHALDEDYKEDHTLDQMSDVQKDMRTATVVLEQADEPLELDNAALPTPEPIMTQQETPAPRSMSDVISCNPKPFKMLIALGCPLTFIAVALIGTLNLLFA